MVTAAIIALSALAIGPIFWLYYRTAKECYDKDREANKKLRIDQ